MKTKAIFTSIFIATMLFVASPVDAQRGEKPRNSGQKPGQKSLCDHIPDLTEDQENQIKELRADYLSAARDLKADIGIKRAEKKKLMIADNPNQNAINVKIDEISDLKSQLQKKKAEKHIKILNLLTDEQKASFEGCMHGMHSKGTMHKDCMHGKQGRMGKHDCMHNK